jgi:hypothetical protein
VLRKRRNQHKRRRYDAEASCVCELVAIEGVSHTAEASAHAAQTAQTATGAFEISLHFASLFARYQ